MSADEYFSKHPWFDDGYRIRAAEFPISKNHRAFDVEDAADRAGGKWIVEYKHIDNFRNADAHLIRAAPELYDLLEDVHQLFKQGRDYFDDGGGQYVYFPRHRVEELIREILDTLEVARAGEDNGNYLLIMTFLEPHPNHTAIEAIVGRECVGDATQKSIGREGYRCRFSRQRDAQRIGEKVSAMFSNVTCELKRID